MSLFKLTSFKIYNRAGLSAHCPICINDTHLGQTGTDMWWLYFDILPYFLSLNWMLCVVRTVILFLAGRSHSGQVEQLKPDALLRLTFGGLTLTLLQENPPSRPDGTSSLAQVSQVFFRELAFFKDSMFSERDFQHLKGSFAKACPHSHLR